MCEPLVARMSAASFPMVCADAVPPAPGRACWALLMTTPLVLENGGVCRETENDMMSGWSRRMGGMAWWRGGGQQAAMKTRAKRAQTRGPVHKFFTPERRFLRMAAELGMVAFKLERLALELKSYLYSPLCASKHLDQLCREV